MQIILDEEMLKQYVAVAVDVSPDRPLLIDYFLEDAIEAEADAISDGREVFIPAVMQHIEYAGIHSGDSACVIPPVIISEEQQELIREYIKRIAIELNVVGLMNMQYAIARDTVYVLEANPRASRTVPLVSKVCNIPMARIATQIMLGKKLSELGLGRKSIPHFGVKEAVFPFNMYHEVDPILGPEMKSTGEVMGVGRSFGEAFGKAQYATGSEIPRGGTAFVSVRDTDQQGAVPIARYLADTGFTILATRGTGAVLAEANVPVRTVNKVTEGRPHIVDLIKNDKIDFVVNTTSGKQSLKDSYTIRRESLLHKVTYYTTLAAARAACEAHRSFGELNVYKLQDLQKEAVA